MQEAATSHQTHDAITVSDCVAGSSEAVLTRFQIPILIAFTVAYGFATWYRAQHKLFWYDEIFTDYISRLPDVAHIWQALLKGADLNPPLLYVLTGASHSLLGHSEASTRLPEIIGFWIFCLCLYRFVSVRAGVLGGLISMIFPCVTVAYYYAYEARAHGIVLGFCGLALVSWQLLTSSSRYRLPAALGLFLALGCALLTHSYAFLLFVPLTAGELTRAYRLRRIDPLVWGALFLAGTMILVSVPLLRAARSILPAGKFLPPNFAKLLHSYDHLFGPAAGVLAIILACICLDVATGRGGRSLKSTFAVYEWVTVLTFLIIPIVAAAVASVTGPPLMDRYSLSVVAGMGALLGVAGAMRRRAGAAIFLLLIFQALFSFGSFIHRGYIEEPSSSTLLSTAQWDFNARYEMMNSVGKNLRVLLTDDVNFAQTIYYAPPDFQGRLLYPHNGQPLVDGFDRLRSCCGVPGGTYTLDSVRQLLNSRTEFLVFGQGAWSDEMIDLTHRHALMVFERSTVHGALFRVTYPQSSSASVP